MTLAQNLTTLPAHVAVDADEELNKLNLQLTDVRRLERQGSVTFPYHEPTPQEFHIANPLTTLEVKFIRSEEKAPVKNAL